MIRIAENYAAKVTSYKKGEGGEKVLSHKKGDIYKKDVNMDGNKFESMVKSKIHPLIWRDMSDPALWPGITLDARGYHPDYVVHGQMDNASPHTGNGDGTRGMLAALNAHGAKPQRITFGPLKGRWPPRIVWNHGPEEEQACVHARVSLQLTGSSWQLTAASSVLK
jgi:hypothetical protein